MPQHEPVVLVNNVYSYRELGDHSIIEAIVGYVRSVAPRARIYLLSQYWEENSEFYGKLGCRSLPPLWDIPMDDNKLRRGILALRSLASLLIAVLRLKLGSKGKGLFPVLDLYQDATLIIDAGGGTLFSSNRYAFYLGLYQHLFNLWMAKLFGKPVVIAPQSIGPFTKAIDSYAVAAVLRKMDLVMVREPLSATLLDKFAIPYSVVPDTAFLGNFIKAPSPLAKSYLEKLDRNCLNIGVTVMDWRWAVPGALKSKDYLSSYLCKIAEALKESGSLHRVRVSIFVQVKTDYRDDDLEVSQRLQLLIDGNLAEVLLVHDILTPSDLYHLYKAMDLVVGTRLHSNILAMIQGVPTVGLSYQPKTKGTFALLGLNEFVLDVHDFSMEELLSIINEMLHRRKQLGVRFSKAAGSARNAVEREFDALIKPFLV